VARRPGPPTASGIAGSKSRERAFPHDGRRPQQMGSPSCDCGGASQSETKRALLTPDEVMNLRVDELLVKMPQRPPRSRARRPSRSTTTPPAARAMSPTRPRPRRTARRGMWRSSPRGSPRRWRTRPTRSAWTLSIRGSYDAATRVATRAIEGRGGCEGIRTQPMPPSLCLSYGVLALHPTPCHG